MKLVPCPVYQNAKTRPEAAALISSNKSLDYKTICSLMQHTAEKLQAEGVIPSQRVAIYQDNSAEYIFALYALWNLKAVGCLLNKRLPQKAAAKLCRSLHADFLLTEEKKWGRLYPKRKTLSFRNLIPSRKDSREAPHASYFDLNQPATIIMTSGSSGEPKAVLHTFGNHYFNALGANKNISLAEGDRWLLSLPLYHVGGIGVILRTFLAGASLVIPNPKRNLLNEIERHRVTHCSLVPTQLIRLMNEKSFSRKTKSLKVILLGGAPVPDTLKEVIIKRKLPVYLTYGLTEMASQVATASAKLNKSNSKKGVPVLTYRSLRIDGQGNIYVKGKTKFSGYLENGKLKKPFDTKGWFLTGDVGSLDENNRLIVKGRRDDMFVSGGENIDPHEIENHILQIPGVERSCVVSRPHPEYGSRPVAFIKMKRGRVPVSKIRSHLSKILPKYKLPDKYRAWPKDKTSSRIKFSRKDLQALVN